MSVRLLFPSAVVAVVALSAPVHAQVAARVKNLGTAQNKTAGSNTLTVTVPSGGVAQNNRIIVAVAMDAVSGTVSASDSRGNSYAVDADVTNSGTVRTLILSANASTSLTAGNTISVTVPSGATAKGIVVSEYSGLMPSGALDKTATGTGNSRNPATSSATTTRANEMLIGVVGAEGPENDVLSPGGSFTTDAKAGTSGNPAATNVTATLLYREVTATGSYAVSARLNTSRAWAAAMATYRAAPSKVVFTNTNRILSAGVCSGTSNPFTVVLQSSNSAAVPPTGTTVLGVSSTSGTATFYSDSACTTAITQLTFSSTESSKTFYVLDTQTSSGSPTLTVSKVSGPDTLSAATQTYAVNGTIGFAQSTNPAVTTLSITLGTTVPVNNRVVITFAMDDPSGGTITASDSRGNTYSTDLDVRSQNQVRAFMFSANTTTALVPGDTISVTFPSVTAKAMTVAYFSGLAQTGAVDVTTSTTGSGTSVTSNSATTLRAQDLLMGLVGVEGPSTETITAGNSFKVEGSYGTNGDGGAGDISVHMLSRQVTATGSYAATGTLSQSRKWAAGMAAYKLAPSQIVFTNTTQTLTAGTCSGTAAPFTLELRNATGVAVPPTGTTVVNLVQPTGSNALFYSDSGCTTAITSVTFSSTQSSQTFYVRDTVAATHTLTVQKASGPEALTDASQSYTVNRLAADRLIVTLPGETFTPGFGNSGTVTTQTASVPFDIVDITMTDVYHNVDTSYSGSVTLSYSGPSAGLDGSQPSYTTAVTFNAGQVSTALPTTLQRAETVSLVVSGAGLSGTSSPLTVVLPADTTTASVTNSPAYAARSSGEIEVSITNGTSGLINQVVLTAPSGWTFDAGSTSLSGWTVSAAAGAVTFSVGTGAAFSNGSTATFRARNSGGFYPNPASDTTYTVPMAWSGFQPGSSSASFTVMVPIGWVELPAVSRSATSARPVFYWTNSDVSQTHAGVMVVRGTDRPTDKQAYAVGEVIGSSVVVCVDGGTGESCTESTLVTQDDGSATYTFYNFDALYGYSNPRSIVVAARPGTGFFYKHAAAGMTPPGVRPGSLSPPGFATFAANDLGLYFVRRDGTEERRAVLLNNQVTRRSLPLSDASAGYAVFTADSGSPNPGTLYRVEPSGSPTTSTTTAAVSSGVGALLTSSAALHSTYKANGPALLFGTNEASGNYIRAVRPDLTAYWTLSIGTDAITHEVNSDVTRAYMFVPVGAGSGGIYAFDMSVDPGAGAAPKPSGWASQKILDGTLFKAQCRMSPTAWTQQALFCGSHSGTLYAINPATGAVIATTSVTGSVQGLVAISSAGYVVYSTRSGRVGKVYFDGTAFKTAADGQANTFEVTVSGAAVVSTPLPISRGIFVGGAGKLHKLDNATGALLGSQTLDGVQVSEVALETSSSTFFVQTSDGTIWGIPAF
ncbi:MAG: hypothetical protein AB2A00_27350 [Myxococcota bacterium]